MNKFNFKQGFDTENDEAASIVIELSVMTNMTNKDVYRLMSALDNEYIKLLREKCGVEEGGFKEWQMCHLK